MYINWNWNWAVVRVEVWSLRPPSSLRCGEVGQRKRLFVSQAASVCPPAPPPPPPGSPPPAGSCCSLRPSSLRPSSLRPSSLSSSSHFARSGQRDRDHPLMSHAAELAACALTQGQLFTRSVSSSRALSVAGVSVVLL